MNAVWQGYCLLAICLTVFLFDLIKVKENGRRVSMSVLYTDFNGLTSLPLIDFRPKSDICDEKLHDYPATCEDCKKMFFGNITLICSLALSWFFDAAAVWNLSITIRNRSKELTSIYSGFAAFFSLAGISAWLIFAFISVRFLDTMTWGLWFLLLTAVT